MKVVDGIAHALKKEGVEIHARLLGSSPSSAPKHRKPRPPLRPGHSAFAFIRAFSDESDTLQLCDSAYFPWPFCGPLLVHDNTYSKSSGIINCGP